MIKKEILHTNGERSPIAIEKNLAEEAQMKNNVGYRLMSGASQMDNFRSPDFYVFLLFERSGGTHSIDFVNYEQKNHQFRISFPGQIHSWKTEEETFGQKLLIKKQLIELSPYTTLFSHATVNRFPVLDLSIEAFKKLDHEFKAIGRGLEADFFPREEINIRITLIASIVSNIIAEKERQEQVLNTMHPVVVKFRELVDSRFKKNRLVSSYAEQLHVSSNYLSIICKRYMGITAKELIDQRLLLECKRLLLGSELRVKEIAFELGFTEMPGFSAYIKEKTGLSPREIKRTMG